MNDDEAERVLRAAQNLAVVIRDEGADAARVAAFEVLGAAGGDVVAALVVTAALVDIGQPTQAWWQQPAQLIEDPFPGLASDAWPGDRCRACDRPMLRGRRHPPLPGFVWHNAKGICSACYEAGRVAAKGEVAA